MNKKSLTKKVAPTKSKSSEKQINKNITEVKSKETVELSDSDKAKLVFQDNETAYKKYLHVRKYSTLKHEECISFVKRIFNIK